MTGHSKLILLTEKKKKKTKNYEEKEKVKTYLVGMAVKNQIRKSFNCLLLSWAARALTGTSDVNIEKTVWLKTFQLLKK